MKTLFILWTFCIFLQQIIVAQPGVGIGTTTPNGSAILDLTSTSKGFLIPRMTTSQRNAIVSPGAGLMVFDTDSKVAYQHDGSIWRKVLNSTFWNSINSNHIYNLSDSVAIGTITPTERLDVSGNIRSRGRIDADGVIEGSSLSTKGGGVLYVSSTSLLSGAVTGNSTASFNGSVSSNTSFVINDAVGTFQLRSGGDDKGFMQLSGDNLRIGTYSTNPLGKLVFRLAGGDRIFIEPDGKMGIGINGADAKLHINSGSSDEALRIQGDDNSIIRFMSGTTEKSYIYSTANDLNISTVQPNGLLRLNGEIYINNTANRTGIGTTTPEERLHVNGNVKVSTGKVLNSSGENLLPLGFATYGPGGTKISGTSNISGGWIGTLFKLDCTDDMSNVAVIVTVRNGKLIPTWFPTGSNYTIYLQFFDGDGDDLGPVAFSVVIYKAN